MLSYAFRSLLKGRTNGFSIKTKRKGNFIHMLECCMRTMSVRKHDVKRCKLLAVRRKRSEWNLLNVAFHSKFTIWIMQYKTLIPAWDWAMSIKHDNNIWLGCSRESGCRRRRRVARAVFYWKFGFSNARHRCVYVYGTWTAERRLLRRLVTDAGCWNIKKS